MHFYKLFKNETEIQGESFERSLNKGNDEAWGSTITGYFNLVNDSGVVKSTGSLTRSQDGLELSFAVPSTDTEALSGKHKLFAHATDSDDETYNNIIAEYHIEYGAEK